MRAGPAFSIRLNFAAAARVSAALASAASPAVSEIMRQAVDAGLLELVFQAQKERFTGAGPFPVADKKLGVQTGRLRRDLHAEPSVFTTNAIRGRIGSVVEYFAAHELGYDGTVNVSAHTRGRYTVKSRGYSVLEQSVRAHSKRMKVPKREPLATAFREHSFRIMNGALQAGYAKLIKGGLA